MSLVIDMLKSIVDYIKKEKQITKEQLKILLELQTTAGMIVITVV